MIKQVNKFVNTFITENRLRLMPWLLRTSTLRILLLLGTFVLLDYEEINSLYIEYGIFLLFVFFFIKTDINNYWQIRGLQHMYGEFKDINRITEALRSTMKLETVLDMIMQNLTRELNYERAFIFLSVVEKQKTVLRGELGIGVLTEVLRQQVFELDDAEGIISRVALEKKPFIIKDAANDHRCEQRLVNLLNLKEFAALPLIIRDNVLGVLVVVADGFTKSEINEEDLTLLEIFANQSAIAIQNARFYEKIERLSFSDELTGLYNHRYFQEKLIEEFTKAEQKHTKISLIYFDLDDFKYYNDTFGHLMGDSILRSIGLILRGVLDDSACPARYGGEEFAVILTGVSKAETAALADMIRVRVENFEFEYKKEDRQKNLTISTGVAVFPDDVKNAHGLIDTADDRLYKAKRSGKNRVVTE